MKGIFNSLVIITSLFVLTLTLKAQERIITPEMKFEGRIKPGDYFKSDSLEVFEGTWQWASADSIFTLELRKGKISNGSISFDAIFGRFSFSVGNKIQFDGIYEGIDNLSGNSNRNEPIGKLKIFLSDPIKGKSGQGIFELSAENSNIAYWEIGNSPGIHVVPEGKKWDPGFSIPTKMTLHRIIE